MALIDRIGRRHAVQLWLKLVMRKRSALACETRTGLSESEINDLKS